MFGLTRRPADVSWKSIEDDFVLGACTRRIIGFAHRGDDGRWSAFDDDARPVGAFARLDDAKAVLGRIHGETHDTGCAAAPSEHPRRTRAAVNDGPAASGNPWTTPAMTQPGSW